MAERISTVKIVGRKDKKLMEIINEADFIPGEDVYWEERDTKPHAPVARPPSEPDAPDNGPFYPVREKDSPHRTHAGAMQVPRVEKSKIN